MASPLHRFRDRADLTLDEVVDAAERLLVEVAPRQSKWAVSERPDVRTIRYYTTRGLLPKPLGYEGGRARYGYPHLLRLLAIKRMQAERMTLEQIARVLAKTDDAALAALVETAEAPALPSPTAGATRGSVPPAGLEPEIAPREPVAPATPDGALVLTLEPGGTLTLDPRVVADPALRAQLADNLVALARMLRATTPSAPTPNAATPNAATPNDSAAPPAQPAARAPRNPSTPDTGASAEPDDDNGGGSHG